MLRVWNLSLRLRHVQPHHPRHVPHPLGRASPRCTPSPRGRSAPWLLAFFGLTVAVTLGLIGWRADRLRSPGIIDSPVSREGAFLANNVLFAGLRLRGAARHRVPAAGRGAQRRPALGGQPVLRPHDHPHRADAAVPDGGRARCCRGARRRPSCCRTRLFWPAWAGRGALVLVAVAARRPGPRARCWRSGSAGSPPAPPSARSCWPPGARAGAGWSGRTNGGMIVHVGVVDDRRRHRRLGQLRHRARARRWRSATPPRVAGHEITYVGARTVEEPNKTSVRAQVRVDGQIYEPAINRFDASGQAVGTPSVRTTLTQDVYLTLQRAPRGRRGRDRRHPGDRAAAGRVAVDRRGRDGRRHDPRRLPGPPAEPARPGVGPGRRHVAAGDERPGGGRRDRPATPWRRRAPTRGGADGPTTRAPRTATPSRAERRPSSVRGADMTDVGPVRRRSPIPVPSDGDGRPSPSATDTDRRGAAEPGWSCRPCVAVVLLIGFVAILATREPATERRASSPLIGKVAPALSGETLDGGTFDIDDQRGRWVVVNFFATWCGRAVEEHPELVRFDEAHAAAGDATVVSVVYDPTTSTRSRLLRRAGRRLAGGHRRPPRRGRLRRRQGARVVPGRARAASSCRSTPAASPSR